MNVHPPRAPWRWTAEIALLLVAGAMLGRVAGLPLDAPLLEGAAGKQTHTAMVARNIYRGRATFSRPRVDDVGEPGYFVKELPVLAAATAYSYETSGHMDTRFLRVYGVGAWFLSAALFVGLLRGPLGNRGSLIAGLWFLISPMAAVYAKAAMTDALAVSASIAALAAIWRWRVSPTFPNALLSAALVAASALLKPHTAFWLGPAGLFLTFSGGIAPKRRPTTSAVIGLAAMTGAGLGLASLWYFHAAAIHRDYPVPGAMVIEGWTDASLLTRPALYSEVGRQTVMMVFTPVGLALSLFGLYRGSRLGLMERALLWWGAGVIVQCFVFAPRMFDTLSRGTEYYQLALVPTAAVLIARGIDALASPAAGRARQAIVLAVVLGVLIAGGVRQSREASQIPERYRDLLTDCQKVQAVSAPTDRFVVFADRGGTVLYYCDRIGRVFSRPKASSGETVATSAAVSPVEISRAMSQAQFVYFPFPELFADEANLPEELAERWEEVRLPDSTARLFRQPRTTGQDTAHERR